MSKDFAAFPRLSFEVAGERVVVGPFTKAEAEAEAALTPPKRPEPTNAVELVESAAHRFEDASAGLRALERFAAHIEEPPGAAKRAPAWLAEVAYAWGTAREALDVANRDTGGRRN